MTVSNNALWNCLNPNQGPYERVLCVCSAGLLRSASLAWFITRNTDANTRNCGIYDYALIRYDQVLHKWANTIIFAEEEHFTAVKARFPTLDFSDKRVIVLDLPDRFEYRDHRLIPEIEAQLRKAGYYDTDS